MKRKMLTAAAAVFTASVLCSLSASALPASIPDDIEEFKERHEACFSSYPGHVDVVVHGADETEETDNFFVSLNEGEMLVGKTNAVPADEIEALQQSLTETLGKYFDDSYIIDVYPNNTGDSYWMGDGSALEFIVLDQGVRNEMRDIALNAAEELVTEQQCSELYYTPFHRQLDNFMYLNAGYYKISSLGVDKEKILSDINGYLEESAPEFELFDITDTFPDMLKLNYKSMGTEEKPYGQELLKLVDVSDEIYHELGYEQSYSDSHRDWDWSSNVLAKYAVNIFPQYWEYLLPVRGDVNEDGTVTFNDAQMQLTYVNQVSLGTIARSSDADSLTFFQQYARDVDKDGDCDIKDAQLILTFVNLGDLGLQATWSDVLS